MGVRVAPRTVDVSIGRHSLTPQTGIAQVATQWVLDLARSFSKPPGHPWRASGLQESPGVGARRATLAALQGPRAAASDTATSRARRCPEIPVPDSVLRSIHGLLRWFEKTEPQSGCASVTIPA
jgi:hypothetical protein